MPRGATAVVGGVQSHPRRVEIFVTPTHTNPHGAAPYPPGHYTETRKKCQDKTGRGTQLHGSDGSRQESRTGVLRSFSELGQALWFLVLCRVGHGSREPILPVAPPTYILYATPVFIAGSKRIHEGSIGKYNSMTITVKRNNPTHPYCSNWQFPHGIVLGNGPSRRGLNLPKLRENAAIYGCNALYRDFKPDFLFANDTNMIVEILQSGYRGKCVFFDTPPIPKDQAENLHFYHKDPATGEEKEVPVTEEFGHKELAKEFIYIH